MKDLNDDCLHEGTECDEECECECDNCYKPTEEHTYCPECKTVNGCSCDEQYQAWKERDL